MSDAKNKERIFVGTRIKQVFEDQDVSTKKILQKEEPGRPLKMSAETF
jgi:hypothetical protein